MRDFLEAFSNREIAIVLWLAILILFAILKAPKQLLEVLKSLFSKIFLPFYFSFFIYFVGVILLLQHMMIWNNALYKDFIFWFFTSAIVSFFKANNVNSWTTLNTMIFQVFSWNIIVEFIVDSYNFTLGFEIVFVAVLAFFTMLFVYASAYKERPGYIFVIKLLNIILSASGLALIVYVISQLITDYEKIMNILSLKSFLFTPIFTLLFSPFIVFTVFFIKYENIFITLNRSKFLSKKRKIKIKYAIIKNANFNFKYINNAHELLLWRKRELQDNDDIEKYLKKAVKEVVNKEIYEF
jgi:hypothetical protein